MCDCNLPTGAVCVRSSCHECIRRAHEGPRYDPMRRTGRTSNAVKQAVLAAAFGGRVAYICSTQQEANGACRIAAEYIAESLKELVIDRVTVAKDCIQFYFANGTVAGRIIFRGMDSEDNINRGMRTPKQYRIIRDHYVYEVLAERAAREQRRADMQIIRDLMLRHGVKSATLCPHLTERNGVPTIEFT